MSEPFAQLPSRWQWSRIDRVASVNARIGWKALTADEYQPDGCVFLSTPNIKGDQIDFENVNYVTSYRYEESPELKLAVGDVLLVKDGNTLGITNLVTNLPRPATVNGSIAVLRPFAAHPGFLRYVLFARPSQERIAALKGGMGVPHLFQWDIKRLPIPLPAISDQARIADFLDAETERIDALIRKKRSLRDLLLARRLAVTSDAVSGHLGRRVSLRNSSLPWLNERPNHWTEVLLRLVARLGSGHTPSREHPEWWSDCTIPWITTGEVQRLRSDRVEYIESTREMISEVGLANSSAEIHAAGTVVLCRTASAGYSGIMKTPMATSQDFATWTCGPLLRPRFLLLCLRAMRQDLLGRLAMGSTHQTIYMPDIRSIRIPLPPVNEQNEIVEYAWSRLTIVDRLVAIVERQIGLLQERRQALITAAVTGALPVPECVG